MQVQGKHWIDLPNLSWRLPASRSPSNDAAILCYPVPSSPKQTVKQPKKALDLAQSVRPDVMFLILICDMLHPSKQSLCTTGTVRFFLLSVNHCLPKNTLNTNHMASYDRLHGET